MITECSCNSELRFSFCVLVSCLVKVLVMFMIMVWYMIIWSATHLYWPSSLICLGNRMKHKAATAVHVLITNAFNTVIEKLPFALLGYSQYSGHMNKDGSCIFTQCIKPHRMSSTSRAVASLTVLGGQEFHFPHFSSNFDQFSLFFLNFY